MNVINLICGVPGSGKTWLCSQLTDTYDYIRNDDYIGRDYLGAVIERARTGTKPLLVDCPFAERETKEKLESKGCKVIPYFIVEDARTVKQRYEQREKKPIPPQHLTRARNIIQRAREWGAVTGTSEEILRRLKNKQFGPIRAGG